MVDMERINRVNGMLQYGHKGLIMDNNDDKQIGWYRVIGLNKLVVQINSKQYNLKWQELVYKVDEQEAHMVPEWD